MIDKLLSLGEDELWLLQSTGYQCFADQFSGTDQILFDVYILYNGRDKGENTA